MNIHEGASRMKRAGQWLVVVPLSITLLFWAISLAASTHFGTGFLFPGGVVIVLGAFVYLAVPGGILWLAGWIVEGFAKADR